MGHSQLSLLGIICIGMLVVSCATSKPDDPQSSSAMNKADFIEFWIEQTETSKNGIWVKLCFRNISNNKIKISEPENLLTAFPHLSDSLGNEIIEQFRAFPEASRVLKTIDVRQVYEMYFYKSIDKYFFFEPSITYRLQFSYYGRIYNEDNKIVANGSDCRSNILIINLE